MRVEREKPCEACGSRLDPGQRYCLGCGIRIGTRSPELTEALRCVQVRLQSAGAPRHGGVPASPADDARRGTSPVPSGPTRIMPPRSGLRLPPAKVSALLVAAFLGFGVLIGDAAGPRVSGTLAASARQPHVVLVPTPTNADPTVTPPGSSSASQTEQAQSESTPPPAVAERATTPVSTAQSKPDGGSQPAAPTGTEGGPAGSSPGSSPSGSASKLPPIKHVFVIMLSDQPYAAVFGPASKARYLAGALESRGELLVRYDAVAHEQLANGVAIVSGQGPTAQTAANCPTYIDIAPAAAAAQEQVLGSGCVYPRATETLAGQLTAKHLTWRSYAEGFDEAGAQLTACGHPGLGQPDPTAAPMPAGKAYATFTNPFLYFHSVIDSPTCAAGDVGIDQLKRDLATPGRTPNFSYIVPDLCHDATSTPCRPGAPAGPAVADEFLRRVVPEITRSRAYRQAGLLVITVDEAPSTGEMADSSSCCGQPQYPNVPPTASGPPGRGGGTVGALLLSPFIKGATTNQEPFNHFSLLRTVEDVFKVKHLGYAAGSRVKAFEPSMFTVAPKH